MSFPLINYLCLFKSKLMSEIAVIEVKDAGELIKFIRFPMELYKNNKNYVPPLIIDEKKVWNRKENPALGYSEAKKFLALKDGKVVGRIAVIINHKEAKELGISKVRFGWLDFIDDFEVSKALIDTAINFAKEKNITINTWIEEKITNKLGFVSLNCGFKN